MKEKYLRLIIYAAGIVCIYAFFSVRFFPLMNAILAEKMDEETRDFNKFGELYYFSCIKDFKVPFENHYPKYRLSDRNAKITEAEIFTYGDSFFDLSFQKNVPELLSESLNKKVFSYVSRDPSRSNPFCLFNDNGVKNDTSPRILIYETVERSIPEKFGYKFEESCTSASFRKESTKETIIKFIFRKNSENLYDVMLKQSYLTSDIYSLISTTRFRLFSYISNMTMFYTTKPEPWLFHEKEYGDGPGGFKYSYTDEEISTYADNVLKLKNSLKEKYNIDLIFLPIPTKSSIYLKLVTNLTYNNFLPRLYKELNIRNITYVDLYSNFANSTEILYHGTDTHWNPKGMDIAVGELLKVLKPYSYNQIGYIYQ